MENLLSTFSSDSSQIIWSIFTYFAADEKDRLVYHQKTDRYFFLLPDLVYHDRRSCRQQRAYRKFCKIRSEFNTDHY